MGAIAGSVTATLHGAPPLTMPLAPVVGLPNTTINIYACTRGLAAATMVS